MDACRICGRPVVRGKYLAWTHANGQARSARPHYASPVRPTSRTAAQLGDGRQSEALDASATIASPLQRRGRQPVTAKAGHSPG